MLRGPSERAIFSNRVKAGVKVSERSTYTWPLFREVVLEVSSGTCHESRLRRMIRQENERVLTCIEEAIAFR